MKFCLSHNILFSFSLIRLNYERTFNASDLYFFVRHPLYIFSSEELLFKDIRNYTYFIEEINRAQQQAVARPLGTEGNRGCTRYYMASERVHLYSGARHPRITPGSLVLAHVYGHFLVRESFHEFASRLCVRARLMRCEDTRV